MNRYSGWMLPLALVALTAGVTCADDSLFSKLGKLDPAAHKLLEETYTESCIVFDSLDRIAKTTSADKSKTVDDWATVLSNHGDYWQTRIQKAARILGTTTRDPNEPSSTGDPAVSVKLPSSYRTWVKAHGRFFEDVLKKGSAWIAQKRVMQWRLNVVTQRFEQDPEKYADVVKDLEDVDKELTAIEEALPKATTHAEALALMRRADKAWNKTYKNAEYLRKRRDAVEILQRVSADYVKQFAKDLKALQTWRDGVKANKVIEPRFVKSIVEVWEPRTRKLVEHYEGSLGNLKFTDDKLLKGTLLDSIPHFQGVDWKTLESPVAAVLRHAMDREKALR